MFVLNIPTSDGKTIHVVDESRQLLQDTGMMLIRNGQLDWEIVEVSEDWVCNGNDNCGGIRGIKASH